MKMTPYRVICGIIWAVIAAGFAYGVVFNLTSHPRHWSDVVVGMIIALLAAWYDYRIWTLKARRLFLVI